MDIRKIQEKYPYNKNIEIPESTWRKLREQCSPTRLSMAWFLLGEKETTFRDQRPLHTLHLKDWRHRNRDEDFVLELEHFNPRYHPIRHLVSDLTLWASLGIFDEFWSKISDDLDYNYLTLLRK